MDVLPQRPTAKTVTLPLSTVHYCISTAHAAILHTGGQPLGRTVLW
jgi:hypothetical protein